MSASIRVMIVDDLKNIRDYFQMILENEPDMEVVATAESGVEAVNRFRETEPEVVLMDIQMETRIAGIEATVKIKEMNPDTKVIILTIHEEDEFLFRAYSAGAMDYIVKTNSVADILRSIRDASKNQLSLKPATAQKILNEYYRIKDNQSKMVQILNIVSRLTNSEYDVLKSAYDGYSYRTIAELRFVEEVTIRGHVTKILRKFNARSMKEVIRTLKEISFFESI